MRNQALYRRYRHMKERCCNKNSKSYENYGGRGIKVCDEWLDSYEAFESWCLANGFADGLAIDRIDNDGPYAPDNCRFVTPAQNNQNRRSTRYYTINGVTKNIQQWCDEFGINRGTVITRLKHGWSFEDAVTKPVKKGRDKSSLIGKKFGKLTVIRYAGDEFIGSDNNSRWVCSCECGNEVVVGGNKLKGGHTKSCGCLQKEIAHSRMISDNPMKRK